MNAESKICATCGRAFHYQKRWQNNWSSVRYCSNHCRKNKPSKLDKQLEERILDLLHSQSKGQMITVSEALNSDQSMLRERARQAARRLAAANKLDILQNGRKVDPSSAKGPLELRLRR